MGTNCSFVQLSSGTADVASGMWPGVQRKVRNNVQCSNSLQCYVVLLLVQPVRMPRRLLCSRVQANCMLLLEEGMLPATATVPAQHPLH